MLFIGSPPSHPTPTNHDTKLLKNQSTLELTQACCLLFSLLSVFILFFPSKPQSIASKKKIHIICLDFPSLFPLSWQFLSLVSLSTFSRSVVIWSLLLQLLQLALACHSDQRSEFQSCMWTESPPSSFKRASIYARPSFQVPWAHCLQQALVTTKIKGLGSYQSFLCLFSKLKGSSSPEG